MRCLYIWSFLFLPPYDGKHGQPVIIWNDCRFLFIPVIRRESAVVDLAGDLRLISIHSRHTTGKTDPVVIETINMYFYSFPSYDGKAQEPVRDGVLFISVHDGEVDTSNQNKILKRFLFISVHDGEVRSMDDFNQRVISIHLRT